MSSPETLYQFLGGLMLFERPDLLRSTRSVVRIQNIGFRCPGVLVWSLSIARVLFSPEVSGVTFASWHDERLNCSTWTDGAGCRCEVDP